MRPFEDSYARIEKAIGQPNQAITVSKFGDEWTVSHHQDHSRGGTIELAAYRLAEYIETRRRPDASPR